MPSPGVVGKGSTAEMAFNLGPDGRVDLRPSRKCRGDILSAKHVISRYTALGNDEKTNFANTTGSHRAAGHMWWGCWSGDNGGRTGGSFCIRLRNFTSSCGQWGSWKSHVFLLSSDRLSLEVKKASLNGQ